MCWIAPFPYIWVCVARVNQLVLLNDVFTSIVLEVLNIQNLGVRVVVDARDACVVWIGDIDDVHVIPTSKIGVGFPIGSRCYLNLGVAWCGQGVEVDKCHVIGARHVLRGVGMVVPLILIERVRFIEND